MSASNSSPGAFFYLLMFAVLSGGALFLLKDYSGPESLPAQVDNPITSLSSTDNLEKGGADLKECIEGYRQLAAAGRYYENSPPPDVIADLKSMGLADPVIDLKIDLKSHPELIPFEGSLGGTMGFHFPDQIHVISSQWVLAYFEDGHNGGYALLKYTVGADARISWKTVDAFQL